MLGIQFIAEGLVQGEPGIVAMFEELPNEFMQRSASFGYDLSKNLEDGSLKLLMSSHARQERGFVANFPTLLASVAT